jgi:formylglycine-generating enzyme required for sulfatase activity/chromosome segregation ATPase/rhodanese-related sulfurtransferase
MGAAKKLIDKKVLRDLVPINALSATHLDEISRKALIEDVRSGTYVFKKGDRDCQTVYLLDGQVEIVDDRNVVDTVTAGSEAARHPLAHKQPRQLGARAAGKVTVARVDSSLLDVLLTWDESAGYDVVEIDAEDNDDWMTRMLQSQAFLQLPPSNIHQLLMRLEAVTANAGDVIVRQDDEGDYFYIVKSGRLAVTRKASPRSKEVLLAELGEGACFGEEALVSGTKRNASVTMLTDGHLMRLSKSDFNDLLCGPLVHEADFEGAQKLVAKGARWLDVRLPGEYENQAISGSLNLPLSALREQCNQLDSNTDYIVCCDTGRRSAAGAFVLRQRGFSVYTLKNGLMDVPEEVLTATRSESPAASGKDADIIPFESENRAESVTAANDMDDDSRDAPVDGILIDKLAAAENDKLALQQQLKELQARLGQAEQLVIETEARERDHQSSLERLQGELAHLAAQAGQRDEQLEQQSAATEQHKAALQDELTAVRKELESSRQQLDSSNDEKGALQAELIRLQQTLSQIQQSADGRDDALRRELEVMAKRLDSEQQRYDKQRRELEGELGRVREDYQQLGQRTSAVAGERDAAARELQQLQQQFAALQDQLNRTQAESRDSLDGVQQALNDGAQALEAKRAESEGLKQKLEELESSYHQLQQQLSAVGESADADKSYAANLEGRLEELQHQHQSVESALHSADQQVKSLEEQLRLSEQQAGERLEQQRAETIAATEQLNQRIAHLQQQLEQTSGEVAAERDVLVQRVQQLEQELQARQLDKDRLDQDLDAASAENQALVKRLADQQQTVEERQQELLERQSEHQALEQQLAELRQQLTERTQQEQGLREELATQLRQEERNAQLQQQAEQTAAGLAAIEAELTEVQKRYKAAEQRNAELEARLTSVAEEYKSDLAGARKALSRAQTETENVQREQRRLMESLRKAERVLEAERQDHEAEVYRLRRELKEAAGESSAGLAAELEALQNKLKEGARARDDLEIKLGERSAQLEDVQAAADKLKAQLQQAQDSARQAEQQLLETNQAANEEMAVRIEAEEKAQQALRDELAAVIAERNRSQEQVTVQLQELDELRAAVEGAQQESAAQRENSQQALLGLQQERDEALQRQLEIQQQLDQLRAEAEVTRGLVDMKTPAEGDAALRDQLEQAKKNVDVAVRLRSQAEHKNSELNAEIARLRVQLEEADLPPAGHIPFLDTNDPHAAAALNPDYPDTEGDEPQAKTVLIDEEQSQPAAFSTASASYPDVSATAPAGGWLKSLIRAVVMGALAVGAGVWWVLKQPSPPHDPQQVSQASQAGVPSSAAKVQPETGNKAASRDMVPQPARIPDFAKGSSPNLTKIHVGTQATEAKAGADRPVAGENAAEPARPPKRQPIRSYSEPLSGGGRAPTMVEFQADSFEMGSGISSPNFDERPRHRVALQRFAISKHEVTFDEYDRFARDSGRSLPRDNGWGRGERPVINVRWQDALAYTQWLSEQTGSRYRLPTEAEWEFASRAGSDARFWWGNEVGDSHANCFDCGSEWAGVKTAPVGSFPTSPFAVNDMAGNVMEWVQDCYQPDYTAAPDDGSAVTGGDCRRRVVRGGGYDSPSESVRSASRDAREADTRLDNLGFRVVKE